MIRDLFGSQALTSKLRQGLDRAMATHRGIADRIAGANSQSTEGDFGQALAASSKRLDEQDLVSDLTQLADTEIRYEVEAKLLNGAYSSIRKAIRGNG
jgi:flagellar basal body rod protein FlgB